MTKSEKLFEMLQYIREYPYLSARDLALLCDVSERGIYRYIDTLTSSGFPVRLRDGGYRLPEDNFDLLEKLDVENLRSVRELLSIGMTSCGDEELFKQGEELIKLVDAVLPKTEEGMLREIVIISEGAANCGGAVTIGYSGKELDMINPILASDTISSALMSLIFSRLVEFDRSQRPVPSLAQKWEVSGDGLVWTFFLREDVKFHDGHPLAAQDVEFTYRAILDSRDMTPKAEQYNMIDKIETKGDHIVRVSLKYPFASFIYRADLPIAPRHLLENADLHDTPFNRRPIGSGPFKLVDWTEDDTIALEANKRYFLQGRPILDRLIFRSYTTGETALQAIAEDETDMGLWLTSADLASSDVGRDFRVYPIPTQSYYALILNLKSPVFRDIRVRKALDYAIDRGSIMENQLKGYSEICTGPFSVDSWSYNSDVQPTPYDIWKARDLLDEAGWRDTEKDGVLDRDSEPFEISIAVPNPSDGLGRIAVAIRAQLMKAGINAKLDYVDVSELSEVTSEATLCMVSAGPDPDSAYDLWHSGSSANVASYENGIVDDLLEQGRQATDIEQRRTIYHRVHRIIHDDYPAIFLASGCRFIGSNYRISDAEFSSIPHFLSTMKDWQIAGTEEDK